jgi:RNA polymerase sigma-70 factor, ECF subfamily
MGPPWPTTPPTDVNVAFGRAWRDHHRHALDIAFRMLGDLGDAEDVVQEAFARLVRDGVDGIDDVRGWLVVVVGRLCLDRLRWRRRHPTEPDPNAAERAAELPEPADRITLDDSIRLALQQVLDRLTPPERAAFVLHDVFQYPFDEIGRFGSERGVSGPRGSTGRGTGVRRIGGSYTVRTSGALWQV